MERLHAAVSEDLERSSALRVDDRADFVAVRFVRALDLVAANLTLEAAVSGDVILAAASVGEHAALLYAFLLDLEPRHEALVRVTAQFLALLLDELTIVTHLVLGAARIVEELTRNDALVVARASVLVAALVHRLRARRLVVLEDDLLAIVDERFTTRHAHTALSACIISTALRTFIEFTAGSCAHAADTLPILSAQITLTVTLGT